MGKYVLTKEGELYHFGIKGMKWGVRRYRNPDGTLTPAGIKRYNSMSNDKLQKTLHKQVKQKRAEIHGGANRWASGLDIGDNSREALKKYSDARKTYENSEAVKSANKKIRALDRKAEAGKIDMDSYSKQYEKIRSSVYKPELDSSIRYGATGKTYVKEYLNSYGKDITMAYIKDLGYDQKTAQDFTERVMRAKTKSVG